MSYVQRKKDLLGIEEYNKIMAEKKRLYRLKLKAEKDEKCENPKKAGKQDNILTSLFSSMTTKDNVPIRPLTVKNYINKLERVCFLVTGKPFDGNFEFIQDPDVVCKALTSSTLTNLKDYITPIIRVLRHFDIPEDKINLYTQKMLHFKEIEYTKRKGNTSSLAALESNISLEDANAKIIAFKPTKPFDEMYKAILCIYFCGDIKSLIPRNDLAIYKLVSSTKKVKDLNKSYNYLIMKDGIPIQMYHQNYKSMATYGPLKFGISPIQTKILTEYLRGKKNGDFMFSIDGNDIEISKPQMAELLRQAGKRIFDVPNLTVDLCRQINSSSFWRTGLHSIQEQTENALRYCHSTKQQMEYIRPDLIEDKD